MLLLTVCMVGCNDDLDTGYLGGKPIFVEPIYVGEEVTTVDKTFTKDEFRVMVSYEDGSHRSVTDFEITETVLIGGVYYVYVDWRGMEGDAIIVLDMDMFTETSAATEPVTEETPAE